MEKLAIKSHFLMTSERWNGSHVVWRGSNSNADPNFQSSTKFQFKIFLLNVYRYRTFMSTQIVYVLNNNTHVKLVQTPIYKFIIHFYRPTLCGVELECRLCGPMTIGDMYIKLPIIIVQIALSKPTSGYASNSQLSLFMQSYVFTVFTCDYSHD